MAADATHRADAADSARPGAIVGLFHAGITVKDLDVSLRFYRDALGLEVLSDASIKGPHSRRIFDMEVGPLRAAWLRVPGTETMLEIFEFTEIERHSASARPCDYGAGHICFYVDDADAVFARVRELGFATRSREVVQIEVGPRAGARAAYMLDPDGYPVEIFQAPR